MEESAAGEESVFVYLMENGELEGLLRGINRSGLKYEHLLAERRLLEDLSGKKEITSGRLSHKKSYLALVK